MAKSKLRRNSSSRLRLELLSGGSPELKRSVNSKRPKSGVNGKYRTILLCACLILVAGVGYACLARRRTILENGSRADEAEMRAWAELSDRPFEEVSLEGEKACRVFGACLLGNGKWAVPKKHRAAATDVLDKCGLLLDQSVSESLKPKRTMMDVDLVNLNVRKVRMLQGDFLPVIAWLDLFTRFADLGGQRKCIEGDLTEHECSDVNLSPSIFLDKEILEAKVGDWRRSLAETFAGVTPQLQLISQQEAFDAIPLCFRSVISTSLISGSIPPALMTDRNVYFRSQGVLRDRLTNDPSSVVCPVKARILQPRHSFQHLESLSTLVTGLVEFGAVLRNQSNYGIQLDVEVLHASSEEDLKSDIKLMQDTDVLVTPHWEYNPAILFMRKGSTVSEVFHYGSVSGPFDKLSNDLGLNYFPASSYPDATSFRSCLEKSTMNPQQLELEMKAFNVGETDRFEEERYDSYEPFNLMGLQRDSLRCILQQKLEVPSAFVKKTILLHIQTTCGPEVLARMSGSEG